MRGGGVLHGNFWLTKARLLRPGDRIRCTHWADICWMGGEVYVVIGTSPSDSVGYLDIDTYAEACPPVGGPTVCERQLCVLLDDDIQLVARDVPVSSNVGVVIGKIKKPRKRKPKVGEQMKMFDE